MTPATVAPETVAPETVAPETMAPETVAPVIPHVPAVALAGPVIGNRSITETSFIPVSVGTSGKVRASKRISVAKKKVVVAKKPSVSKRSSIVKRSSVATQVPITRKGTTAKRSHTIGITSTRSRRRSSRKK